jgi:hypothetical protein
MIPVHLEAEKIIKIAAENELIWKIIDALSPYKVVLAVETPRV